MLQSTVAAHGAQAAIRHMINDRFSGLSTRFGSRADWNARLAGLPSEIDVPVHGDCTSRIRCGRRGDLEAAVADVKSDQLFRFSTGNRLHNRRRAVTTGRENNPTGMVQWG